MAQAGGPEEGNIVSFRKGRPGGAPPSEPAVNLPPAVKGLALALAGAFVLLRLLPFLAGEAAAEQWLSALAFFPARYTGDMPFGVAAALSPVTHMFLHGGWMHLGVNVVSLMAFGAGVEKALGGRGMLLLFFASGLAGAAAHGMVSSYALAPMIGASGGVSGLFGAVLVLMRDTGQLGGAKRLAPFVIIWLGASLLFGLFGMPGTDATIAWATHVGGFIAGMALYRFVARPRF